MCCEQLAIGVAVIRATRRSVRVTIEAKAIESSPIIYGKYTVVGRCAGVLM